MGRYDDITPEELRGRLLKFARLVRAMEKQGVLLQKAPSLLRLLGELRQMIFAYEVRATRTLSASDPETEPGHETEDLGDADAAREESLRIVREALERERELQDELRDGHFGEDGEA